MASRKDELKKAKEAGKSIVANKFADTQKADAPKESATPIKKEELKKEQSLVANKFGAKKEKTWNDVKSEYNNDPAKIADYLNNATDYTPGNLTKKGMEEFGYSKGDDGKWAPKPKTETTTTTTETKPTGTTTDTSSSATTTGTTTDDSISELEKLMAENEKLKKQIEALQNSDGSINKDKAKSMWDKHMQKGLEIGAVTLDKDGNYVLTNVNKKGWEDWATMISAGASVIGLAMGIPIIPINFRKITGKDEKDEAIREFQKQLTDISAGNLAKVEDVKSSVEAGKLAKANEDNINAYSKYKEDVGAYEAKSNIDTDSEKDLIETRTNAQIKADEARFKNEMKRIKDDQNFQLNIEALREQYKEQFAALESALMTGSAKELSMYQNGKMFKEMEEMGITPSKLATWKAAQASISPSDKIFNKINTGVNTVTNLVSTVLGRDN